VNEYEQKYQYDKMGNVLQVKQLGTNTFTRNFTYNTDVNTLQKVETGGATLIENYTYDFCGNQVTAGTTRRYQWTAANRLLIYRNQTGSSDPTIYAQYDYDAAGNRVSKLVRTGTAGSPIYYRTIYIDGIYEYHRLENGTIYKKSYAHVADGSSKVLSIRVGDVFPDDISDTVVVNLEDQLGGTTIRLNSSGNVIDREEYYPFGDSSLRTFSKKQYRYVGKEKDAESGLYYYGARYYSAWTCRFISVDALAKKYNQLTPYQNAGNNPVGDKDIDGNKSEKTPEGGGQKEGGGKKGKTNDAPNTTTENIQPHGGGLEDFERDKAAALDSGKDFSASIQENEDGSESGSITIDGKVTNYTWGKLPDNKKGDVPLVDFENSPKGLPSTVSPKVNVDPMPTKPVPDVRNKSSEPSIQPPNQSTPPPAEQEKSGLWAKIGGFVSNIKSFTLSKAEKLIMAGKNLSGDTLKLLKGLAKAGKALGVFGIFLGIADAGIDIYQNGLNWKTVTKASIGIGLGIAAIFAGPALGVGIAVAGIAYGILDFSGKLDEGLDYLENKYGDDIENKWNKGKAWLKHQEKLLIPQGR
jgi:RHS repeat-associated protein